MIKIREASAESANKIFIVIIKRYTNDMLKLELKDSYSNFCDYVFTGINRRVDNFLLVSFCLEFNYLLNEKIKRINAY